MNNRPTPETNAAYKYWPCENVELVDADFARKLERERDEAKELAQAFHSDQVTLLLERDEARMKLAKITEAAAAVVGRWEQPVWKDVEPTAVVIYKLRDALEMEAE